MLGGIFILSCSKKSVGLRIDATPNIRPSNIVSGIKRSCDLKTQKCRSYFNFFFKAFIFIKTLFSNEDRQ